jgi:hypothetical protein
MGGWLALIPGEWRLWLVSAVVFTFALFGVRLAIRRQAFNEVEVKRTKSRLKAVLESEKVEENVENMDRDALIRAASEWVR